jgi:hypothetical protein
MQVGRIITTGLLKVENWKKNQHSEYKLSKYNKNSQRKSVNR